MNGPIVIIEQEPPTNSRLYHRLLLLPQLTVQRSLVVHHHLAILQQMLLQSPLLSMLVSIHPCVPHTLKGLPGHHSFIEVLGVALTVVVRVS